uniref:Uncharacterized protein n=1 Tax=Pyramimonas orientalis virus TaxID=455367 RepID=A0A7M3UP76_POV01|nr:hypothetical protein HWQ62_00414 [Pyramimonas orientalis virus]
MKSIEKLVVLLKQLPCLKPNKPNKDIENMRERLKFVELNVKDVYSQKAVDEKVSNLQIVSDIRMKHIEDSINKLVAKQSSIYEKIDSNVEKIHNNTYTLSEIKSRKNKSRKYKNKGSSSSSSSNSSSEINYYG